MIIELHPKRGDTTRHLQAAIDCAARQGDVLRLMPGLHLSGTLRLPSNLSLEIVSGAILKAIDKPEAFVGIQSSAYSRMDFVPWKAFLHADGVENIRLFGHGTIDGSGALPMFKNGISVSPDRPYGLHFIRVRNLEVKNLTLRNSAYWMLRTLECEEVRLIRLNIFNHANLNNDGIDIDGSRRVLVHGCRIDTSDDALCLKAEGASPCENVVCSDCQLATHASAIKFGTASIGGFSNISISNMSIHRSAASKVVHQLGFSGGIQGIDIAAVDGGVLRNVIVSNIVMDGPASPIFLRHGKRLSRKVAVGGECTVNDRSEDSKFDFPETRCFEDVHIHNVIARNLSGYPVVVCGYPGAPIRRVTLRDITLIHREIGECESPPTEFNDAGYPNIGMFGTTENLQFKTRLNAHGLFTRCVDDLTVENFHSIPALGDRRSGVYHHP